MSKCGKMCSLLYPIKKDPFPERIYNQALNFLVRYFNMMKYIFSGVLHNFNKLRNTHIT